MARHPARSTGESPLHPACPWLTWPATPRRTPAERSTIRLAADGSIWWCAGMSPERRWWWATRCPSAI